MNRLAKCLPILLIVLVAALTGCAGQGPHPVLEHEAKVAREMRPVEEACKMGRETAQRSGAQGLEFYAVNCE